VHNKSSFAKDKIGEIGFISRGSQKLDWCTDKISAIKKRKLKTELSLEIMMKFIRHKQ